VGLGAGLLLLLALGVVAYWLYPRSDFPNAPWLAVARRRSEQAIAKAERALEQAKQKHEAKVKEIENDHAALDRMLMPGDLAGDAFLFSSRVRRASRTPQR
jgi:hypothetical protein